MVKKMIKDIQLSFEFEEQDRKIKFVSLQGRCKCGFKGEFNKADIVLEMTIPCPQCGSIIRIVSS